MDEDDLREMLARVTGGRQFCFVVMTWHANYPVFKEVQRIVQEETGFGCIRADDVPPTGDMLRKIHYAIDHAVLVIADLANLTPNMYYEIGYAVARRKPVLFLAGKDTEIPADLMGMEIIRYDLGTAEGYEQFQRSLRQHMTLYHPHLLRGMIIPPKPEPAFILVERKPFAPTAERPRPNERRTFGDHLGVVGILGAYGSVYGDQIVPDLLTVSQTDPDLVEDDASFYAIGSDKVNKFTARLLDMIQQGRSPNWRFGPRPGEEDKADQEHAIYSDGRTQPALLECEPRVPRSHPGFEDYGLIVRGPKPGFPGRMLTVLAGPHSMGTGAACLAATRSERVQEIQDKLGGKCDLAACEQSIWALVRGRRSREARYGPADVTVVDAGVY